MTPPVAHESAEQPAPRNEQPVPTSVVDPRIDKVISWTLMFAAGVALSVGAWFFAGLQRGMDDLKKEIVGLQVQLAHVEKDRLDIDDLKKEVHELRAVVFQLRVEKR